MPKNARLVVEGRGNWVFSHSLEGLDRVTIGRTSDNDIELGDMLCSSRHAEIRLDGDVYYLKDLGSRNGSFLNGDRIKNEQALRNGDTIQLGKSSISFLCESEDPFGNTMMREEPDPATLREQTRDPRLDSSIEQLETLRRKLDSADADTGGGKIESIVENLERELQAVRRRAHEQALVAELYKTYARPAETAVRLRASLDLIAGQLGAQNAFLMQINPETRKWTVRARYGDIQDWSATEQKGPLPLSLTIVEQCVRSGEPVVSEKAGDDKRFEEAASVMELGIQSCLCFPLKQGGKVAGVCYADSRSLARHFDEEAVSLFTALVGGLNELLYPEA